MYINRTQVDNACIEFPTLFTQSWETLSPGFICTHIHGQIYSFFLSFPSAPFPAEVYKVRWWMGHYGHSCPKRHKAFTNNRWASRYNKGKLNIKQFKASSDPSEEKPTRQYIDSKGVRRYAGTRALKRTQWLGLVLRCFWHCCSGPPCKFPVFGFYPRSIKW